MANKFSAAKSTEFSYARELRKIATIVAGIVNNHIDGAKLIDEPGMIRMLQNYADALTPWAIRAATRMIRAVALRNQQAFNSHSKIISTQLRLDGSVERLLPELQQSQVKLIKSIPIEAGERAQRLAREAALNGTRSTQIAEMLMNTEGVTKSRATLIARTETAKANAFITQARSQEAGIEYYRWQTAEDGVVRPSHAEMDNKIFQFNNPPTLSDGMTGNPGEFPNCFPGSTNINALPIVEKFFRHFYSGKLTTLVFDNGDSFTATPNHPIFGINGLNGIDSFNVGDYVICESHEALQAFNVDANGFNIEFEKLFNAINVSPVFKRSTSIGGEFHGDRTDQEVDIVSVDWLLVAEVNSFVDKKFSELGFADAQMRIMQDFLISDSGSAQFIERLDSSFDSYVSSLNLMLPLLLSHFTPLELFCFALTSERSLSGKKAGANDGSANQKIFGDLTYAYSILVHGNNALRVKLDSIMGRPAPSAVRCYASSAEAFSDQISANIDDLGNFDKAMTGRYQKRRIVNKFFTDFSGHVYNLQTANGYYSVKKVPTSNCRCFAIPIIPGVE